ncbi:MAG: DUF3794 domain-containing protein [Oscillospiraceae bacterium]|jgi:hypothetical protein|nr:DUF3794 domain-containing protein [Oscillospiraceae bacterium]
MKFQVAEQTIGVSAPLFEGRAEQAVDADITLPEYCPDCQRVLKCTLTPGVKTVQAGGGRVTADCNATLRVLYCGEDGRVHCYDQNYPFTQEVSVPGVQAGDCASVKAETSYVNCRAVSPRRMDIHGMVHCLFRVRRRKEQPVISGAQGCGVQMKTTPCRVVSAAGEAAKSFPVAEVVELAADAPPVGQILHTQGVAVAQDLKAIANKMLLKGELQLKVFYLPDGGGSEPAVLDYAIPLSQIVEVEGIDEDCTHETQLTVPSLELTPRADASGERRLLDVNAAVLADIRAMRELEVPIAVDAYSTESELDTEYRNMEFLEPLDSFAEKVPVTGTVQVPGGAGEILGMWTGEPVANAAAQDTELAITGSVPLHFLYKDSAGETAFAEKPLEFRFRRALGCAVQRLKCRPQLTLINIDYTPQAGGEVQVRADMNLAARSYDLRERRVIVGLQPDESRPKDSDVPALMLYYADPGESVWDIAREYNTTAQSIVDENSLTGEALSEAQMLLIPRV